MSKRKPKSGEGRPVKDRPVNTRGTQANQWQVDPRQAAFLKNYLDPTSATYSNAYRSALAAGYAEEYAVNIKAQAAQWLTEKLEQVTDEELIGNALATLKEYSAMDTKEQAMGAFGPLKDKEGNPIMKDNVGKMAIKSKTAEFITERLMKKKWGRSLNLANDDDAPLRIKID